MQPCEPTIEIVCRVLLAAFVAVRVEEIEPALHVREHAVAVVEQHHGVVFFGDFDLALADRSCASGVTMLTIATTDLRRTEQAGQARQVVDAQVGHAAAALFVEERRPIGARVAVVGVGRGDAAELARGKRLGHERELRAADDDRRAPHAHAFRLGLLAESPGRRPANWRSAFRSKYACRRRSPRG